MILAIIALIAVPIVFNIIDLAKEGAFKSSVSGVFKATQYRIMDGETSGDISTLSLKNMSNFSGYWMYKDNTVYLCDLYNNDYQLSGELIEDLNGVYRECASEEGQTTVIKNGMPLIELKANIGDITINTGDNDIVVSVNDLKLKNIELNQVAIIVKIGIQEVYRGNENYVIKSDSAEVYDITYTGMNNGRKSNEVTRKITVNDVSAPIVIVNNVEGINSTVQEIELGTGTYIEYGATSPDGEITITGVDTININQVGEYEVVYSVTKNNKTTNARRIVKVVDTTKPIIDLIEKEEAGDNFVVKVTASDISGIKEYSFNGIWQESNQKVIVKGQIVNIIARDNNGNISNLAVYDMSDTVEPSLIIPDNETIVKGTTINLNTGVVYDTNKVKNYRVASNPTFNKDVPGVYTIAYTVTNYSGLSTTKIRVIEVINSYLLLDGVDDYVDLGGANYNLGNKLSVVAKVKLHRISANQYFVGNAQNAGFYFYVINSGAIRVGFYMTDASEYTLFNTTERLVAGKYYTIAFTYDGSNVRIYINGGLILTAPMSGNLKLSTMPVFIGANPNPGTHDSFVNMDVSEVAIFNRALTTNEIANNYNYSINISNPTSIWGHYRFNTGIGATVYDLSGNGRHGTIVGGAWKNN